MKFKVICDVDVNDIKLIMKKNKISYQKIANKLKLSKSYIYAIINDKKICTERMAIKIMEAVKNM